MEENYDPAHFYSKGRCFKQPCAGCSELCRERKIAAAKPCEQQDNGVAAEHKDQMHACASARVYSAVLPLQQHVWCCPTHQHQHGPAVAPKQTCALVDTQHQYRVMHLPCCHVLPAARSTWHVLHCADLYCSKLPASLNCSLFPCTVQVACQTQCWCCVMAKAIHSAACVQ
jgi:hypothetical protein